MAKSKSIDLLTWSQPALRSRLFPILVIEIILISFYRFFIFSIWEPIHVANVDFDVYYYWITHEIQSPDWNTYLTPFYPLPYTPCWWFLLAPFSLITHPIAKQLWYLCNLLMVIWFIYQSYRWLHLNNIFRENKYLEYVIPMVLFFNYIPIMKTLRAGQGNIIALFFAAISLIFYLKNRRFLAGVCLAVSILTKLSPAFLLLYWLVKREYKVVWFTLVSMAVLWLITIPILGIQLQIDYFRWIFTYPLIFFKNPLIQDNNMSILAWLSDFIRSLGLPSLLALLIFAIYLFISLGWWYKVIRLPHRNNLSNSILEYGWAMAFIPILTQYTEDHHYVYLCILFSGVILFLNKALPLWIWFGITIGWILMNCTFFLYDLKLVPLSIFVYRYFYMYGVVLVWISGGILLYNNYRVQPVPEPAPSDDSTLLSEITYGQ